MTYYNDKHNALEYIQMAEGYDENELDQLLCPRCAGSGAAGLFARFCKLCKGSGRVTCETCEDYLMAAWLKFFLH